jgi:predicted  nucleic acid-binding Zn-ribbon protein
MPSIVTISEHEYDHYQKLQAENMALRAIIKAQSEDLEAVRQEALRLALELREAVDRAKALEGRQL